MPVPNPGGYVTGLNNVTAMKGTLVESSVDGIKRSVPSDCETAFYGCRE